MRNGIILAGSMIMDHIKCLECFPSEGELSPLLSSKDSPGGLVCNTGIDLSILDPTLPLFAAGNVGNDADGEKILSILSAHHLDISRINRVGQTSFTDVFSTPAQRTMFQYGGACDLFAPEEAWVKELPGKILHIGYVLLLKALDAPDPQYGTRMARLLCAAKEAGLKTSLDMVSDSGERYAEIVPPALRYTDYLTLNELEAGMTVGISLREDHLLQTDRMEEVLHRLRQMGVKKWVVIHCPEGAFGMDETEKMQFVPSARVPDGWIGGKVGAGDAFCAGVLLAAHRELPMKEALRFGNAAAQMSLRSEDATGSMTTIEEALKSYDQMLKEN